MRQAIHIIIKCIGTAFSFSLIFYLYYIINFRKKQISTKIDIHFFLNKYSFSEVGILVVRQPKYIPLILYHKFLDITNFRGSWEREKELLEIFSGNFFVEFFSGRAS